MTKAQNAPAIIAILPPSFSKYSTECTEEPSGMFLRLVIFPILIYEWSPIIIFDPIEIPSVAAIEYLLPFISMTAIGAHLPDS